MERAAEDRPPPTAYSDNDVSCNWLTNDARDERFIDNIFAELCLRLQARRHPPQSARTLHVVIQHPPVAWRQRSCGPTACPAPR